MGVSVVHLTNVRTVRSVIKCKRDCFNCPYSDCLVDSVNKREMREASIRDSHIRVSNGIRPIDEKTREYRKAYMKRRRQAIKEGTFQQKRPHKKRVIQYTIDGIKVAEYESVAAASRAIEGRERTIGRAARGQNPRGRSNGAYGYDWRYADE